MPISAVVATYNVADELPSLLEDLEEYEETIIVDSQSDDDTRQIARDNGAFVVDAPQTAPGEAFDHFRERGIERASCEWVLTIDADERLTSKLKKKVQDFVENPQNNILEAPRTNYFDGKPLHGQWPNYQILLFRPESVTVNPTPHSFFQYDQSDVHRLPVDRELAIQHFYAESIRERFISQRRYARIAGNHVQFNPIALIIGPFRFFLRRFLAKEGYKDGFLIGGGLAFCMGWYRFESQVWAGLNQIKNHKI